MSSSFIQVKPIGSNPMGMLPWHNPLSSPDFPQARRRVSCNLFGRPERGALNEIYRQEEQKRLEMFQQRYIFDFEELPKPQHHENKPEPKSNLTSTTATSTRPQSSTKTLPTIINIAESRLSGGESLIEKELREHEMKLKQKQKQHKKTVNCNEKVVVAAATTQTAAAASDRIKSRNLKSEEHNTAARTFVDSSKCASGHGERPKPYARQQSSMTDYYSQRKTVVCNSSRTDSESSLSATEEIIVESLSIVSDESVKITASHSSAVCNHDSLPSSSSLSSTQSQVQQSENESSQHPETTTLQTMTTDV